MPRDRDKTLDLLHLDDRVVAVRKAAGWVVHRSREARDRVTCLSATRDRIGRRVFPVHRLDRGTSGVLLFALDSEAAAHLQRQLSERTMRKSYYAIVRGWFAEPTGTVHKEDERTDWQEIARVELPRQVGPYATARWSLVRLRPWSGKRHQLRRHLSSIGHPILGDSIYGDGRHNRAAREILGVRRLFLIAREIEFAHPEPDGRRMSITAGWDQDWLCAFARLGWPMLE